MKEIDEYLKLLYKSLNATDKEIKDLKEEMKNHLLESVYELEAEGKSPQESVHIAIERFGDPIQLSNEIPQILMVSRRNLLRFFLTIGCTALVVIAVISIICFDNFNKQKELQQAQAAKQSVTQELRQAQEAMINYDKIFKQAGKLASAIDGNSVKLSEVLKAEYNIKVIDQISDMNEIFNYHNGVLLSVAVIAADTSYECPHFKDIAELGVMKLSESNRVIDLAVEARRAKTPEDMELLQENIERMKKTAELKTYQDALDRNGNLK